MKKLLLILSLLNPALNAMSDDALSNQTDIQNTQEQSAASIRFLAKFKALHTIAIQQYSSVEKLFKECATAYISIYEQLENLSDSYEAQSAPIKEQIELVGLQLAAILNDIKMVNAYMKQFNASVLEDTAYDNLTSILLDVVETLTALNQELEAVLQEEKDIASQTIALTQQLEESHA